MGMGRVLVVDDEQPLARIVGSYLEREGFEVSVAHDGPSALEAARQQMPMLVVLDIMLPGSDGISVCRELRGFTDAYILMLTARDHDHDKVAALTAGADDYLVKPFSSSELVARCHAMLRRPRTHIPASAVQREDLGVGGLVLSTHSRTVTINGADVDLTPTEFGILELLLRAQGGVVTREEILEAMRGGRWYGDDQVVDAHIARLRAKLGDTANPRRFVLTVRGVGYRRGPG